MKKFLTRLAAVGVCCCALSAFATFAQAQTLHLITLGNPEGFATEKAKEDVKTDLENIRKFFQNHVPPDRLNCVAVEKKTPRIVISEIYKLNVQPDDVVVFYYTGHAGNEIDAAGHVFQLFEEGAQKEQRLARKDVRKALEVMRPRLIVLLSDCCNNSIGALSGVPTTKDIPTKPSPFAQKFFFDSKGCVDITSSKLGQFSFTGDGKTGSLATGAWISVFQEVNKTLKDAKLEWRDVANMMIAETEKRFKEKYPEGVTIQGVFQDAQTPHVYELPNSSRLGARVQTRSNQLVVTQVLDDFPAARAGMKVGDVLVAIRYLDSMKEIRPVDETQYGQAIDRAPRDVEITIKRSVGKQTKQEILTVELNGLPVVDPDPDPDDPDPDDPNTDDSNTDDSNSVAPVSVAALGVALKGQEIVKVDADSPAANANLEVGDKIVGVNGAKIQTAEDLDKALEAKPESATLAVVKKSSDKETDVVVRFAKKSEELKTVSVGALGVSLKGQEIVEVVSGSPAANAKLEVGDKIVNYNGAPIQTGDDLVNSLDPKQFGAPVVVLKKSNPQEPTDVVVPFYRAGLPMFGATVQGQKITNVVADSPAALAGLEVGDVMETFNGMTIKSGLDFEKAVDASPRHAQVAVRKTTTNQQVVVDLYLNLDPNKPAPVPPVLDPNGPVFGATVQGQTITVVVVNSPAAIAGLQVGDKIISFNGASIQTAEDYSKAVDASPVDANLVVLKKGTNQQTNVAVRLNKSVPNVVPDDTPSGFGATFNGQTIAKIIPGSPADKAGLKVGDKLVLLNGVTVQNEQAIIAALAKSQAEGCWGRAIGSDGNVREFKYTLNK